MKSISRKFMILMFVAVAFLSACNKPSEASMSDKAIGQWNLTELFVNDQVIADYSADFILDLEREDVVVFVNHDGIGMTGTWTLDEAGTTLTLTSDQTQEVLTFTVHYLLMDKMAIGRTISSGLLGDQMFTYVLEK